MFKVNVSDPVQAHTLGRRETVSAVTAAAASWRPIDLGQAVNANVSDIFYPSGGYVSPRPTTCSARIGTDGYSAWTFTYGQGNKAPRPLLNNVTANLDGSGRIRTPDGGLFDATRLIGPPPLGGNVAFTSQWDNYPTAITVNVSANPGDTVWLMIAGSTNPMQTLLPNAQIRFDFSDDGRPETIDLIPPMTFWSLSKYGGKYYDYGRDAFCLPVTPPAMVSLGTDCNAMVYSWNLLAPGRTLRSVTLETLSLEVVVGLMGLTVMSV